MQEDPIRNKHVTALFGWVKDSDSVDNAAINAEEVEQLDDLLTAQETLKDNIRVSICTMLSSTIGFLIF